MKLGKDILARKSVIISIIVAAIMMGSAFLISSWECDYFRKEENGSIAALVGVIKEQYPEVEISDVIQILNYGGAADREASAGEDILKKYGIADDMYYIQNMQHMREKVVYTNILLVVLLETIFVMIVLVSEKKRRKKITQITQYVDHISNGDYSLDLSDNSEDELSRLKNELYKITIKLKEQNELSRQQHEALSDAVSDISHQLKTPLTSIGVLVDNLTDTDDIDPQIRRKFLAEISKQIMSLNWMVVTMLKISRLDAGVVTFAEEDISLKQLIEEVVENMEVIAELQNVQIKMDMDGDSVIQGDRNWNREAISNIVKNSIEHSESGAKVEINVIHNEMYTKIMITNYGREISKEEQKHIFERFYSGSSSIEHGVGIGLALAKSIIEKQNGYVDVQSDQEKTTFIIKYLYS